MLSFCLLLAVLIAVPLVRQIICEDVVPANPGEGMDYPNSPNVGILSAQVG